MDSSDTDQTWEEKTKLADLTMIKVIEDVNANPPRDAWKDRLGFNVMSLGDWLELCKKLAIDHVPAELVMKVPTEEVIDHIDKDFPEEWAKKVEEAKVQGNMLRWDCCAGMEVKSRMALGKYQWDPDIHRYFHLGEPRTADIIYEFPDKEIALWKRRWVEAKIIDKYPVEYRVFVNDGEIKGIANYYPQRELEYNRDHKWEAGTAGMLASRIIKYIEPPLKFNGHCDLPSDSLSFTLDFIVNKYGLVDFLEGGPPFGAGAHPCAFSADMNDWHDEATFHWYEVPVALNARHYEPTI